MAPVDRGVRSTIRAAALTSAAIIAYQVAGKATRDAFFLSTFDVTALPSAVLGSAVLSLAAVLAASRALTRWGPARLLPVVFSGSALLLLAEWALATRWPRLAAAAVYLHFNAFGALLISGFWSLVSERFDPRTAKRQVGRIGGAGTAGGLVGGLLAERMAVAFPVTAMLPVLASIHLLAAATVRGLAGPWAGLGTDESERGGPAAAPPGSATQMLARIPHLRALAGMVLLVAITEGA
ncbi:MAG: hypothetical protein HY560_12640, partial [Gemmatimonadetes bacterium]|nr:hypothetical protein [Gemmatimonadota bacterium]